MLSTIPTSAVGAWISAYTPGLESKEPDIPVGTFAFVANVNDAWFAVDAAGNVRGNPEAVEREALTLASDNLIAMGILGLARLARLRLTCGLSGVPRDGH
jgi:hypothetical protein